LKPPTPGSKLESSSSWIANTVRTPAPSTRLLVSWNAAAARRSTAFKSSSSEKVDEPEVSSLWSDPARSAAVNPHAVVPVSRRIIVPSIVSASLPRLAAPLLPIKPST
jgi:hypothetical protein